MNFKELKEKSEILNILAAKKVRSLENERELLKLKSELSKYSHLFVVSEKAFQEAIIKHYKSFGKVAKFTVETTPASGYHDVNKYVTKNYVVSIYDEKGSNVRPEKRYTWLTRTISKDNSTPAKADLSFDLLSPTKTSLFEQTPGLKEVYWSMIRENCLEKFKQQAKAYINPKTGKRQYEKFSSSQTDLSFLEQPAETKTSTPSAKTIG